MSLWSLGALCSRGWWTGWCAALSPLLMRNTRAETHAICWACFKGSGDTAWVGCPLLAALWGRAGISGQRGPLCGLSPAQGSEAMTKPWELEEDGPWYSPGVLWRRGSAEHGQRPGWEGPAASLPGRRRWGACKVCTMSQSGRLGTWRPLKRLLQYFRWDETAPSRWKGKVKEVVRFKGKKNLAMFPSLFFFKGETGSWGYMKGEKKEE